jgi:hypothetical protein
MLSRVGNTKLSYTLNRARKRKVKNAYKTMTFEMRDGVGIIGLGKWEYETTAEDAPTMQAEFQRATEQGVALQFSMLYWTPERDKITIALSLPSEAH